MHDSFLNVHGLEQVFNAVKKCYASLWTLRALYYRQKMGLKYSEVVPAVVIMKKAKAEAAGIGFSCNPQSGRLDQLVINANYGLGESVVGGTVDPDQYILDIKPLLPKIVTKVAGLKQWMTVAKDGGGTELQKPALLGLNSGDQVLSDTKQQFFLTEPFQPLHWENLLPDASAFKQRFREFLKEYGHRAVYELDLTNPRWRDDPSYLLEYVRGILDTADLKKFKTKQRLQAEKIRQQVNSTVPFYRIWKINWLIRQAIRGEELREKGKSELVRQSGPLRALALDIGRRLKERGILEDSTDVFYCSFLDVLSILLGYWNGQGLKALVADRKERHTELQKLDPPDLIIDERAHFIDPISVSAGGQIIGIGVASGRVEGKAKLLFRPEDGLEQGEVLVAPSTDPGWTSLFLKAAGIIMETGGFLSHGAIVAREYGIPAVVNIPGVMNLINLRVKSFRHDN